MRDSVTVSSLAATVLVWAIGTATAAWAQSLPAVSTTDNIVTVAWLDFAQVEPSALRAAVETLSPEAMTLIAPKIKRYELLRKRLTDVGVQRLGTAVGVSIGDKGPSEISLLLFELRPGKRPRAFEATVLKTAMGEALADMHEAKLSGNWVVAYPKGRTPDFDVVPGEHAKKIEAALKSLGKRPGAAVVLGQPVDQLVAGPLTAIGQMLPPSVVAGLQAVRGASWASVVAKADDKPALKITLQMADDEQAKKFAADWPGLSKDLRAFFKAMPQLQPAARKEFPPPPGLRLLALLPELQAKQQDAQVALTLNSKFLGQVFDIAVLSPARFLIEAADNPHLTEEVCALGEWIRIYRESQGELPKSLADLKPLLGETTAQQEAVFKKLLTHPRTGEFPAYRFTRPAVDPQPDADVAAKTVVFEELKDGKPDPSGYREYQDGHLDLGGSEKEPE